MFVQRAQAVLVFEEPFEYPTLANLGTPWTSGGSSITVQAGNLNYAGLQNPTTPGALVQTGISANQTVYRAITNSAFPVLNGGSFYVSFLLNLTSIPNTTGTPVFGLDDNATVSFSAPGASSALHINVKQYTSTNYLVGIRKGQGSTSAGTGVDYATNLLSLNATNLIVAKYTFFGSAGEDTVTLWINPSSLGGSEPIPAIASTNSGNTTDAGNIAFVFIRANSGGASGGDNFDTIRIGDSWADVTPSSAADTSPLITSQPLSQTNVVGQSASFSVTSTGAAPLSYQWVYNTNSPLADATNASFILVNLQQANAGNYSVVITNSIGSVTSSIAALVISNRTPVAGLDAYVRGENLPLSILKSDLLTNDSDADGDLLTLAGVNLTTTNGVALTTNTTSIFYPFAANVNDSFTYTISDGFGGSATGLVLIVISNTPTGVVKTASVSDSSASLTYAAVPGYVYEVERSTNLAAWSVLTTNVVSTNGLFSLVDTFADQGGPPLPEYLFYRLLFLSASGTAPAFFTQPQSLMVTQSQNAVFTAAASGLPAPTYQWYFNSGILIGQTNTGLTILNSQTSNVGNYYAVAANGVGATTSSIAALSLLISPSITTPPSSLAVTQGQAATFSVLAAGSTPLSYQWFYDTNTALVNATNTSFTLNPAQVTNAGTYSVIVTNSAGSVTSLLATLTVSLIAPSISTQPSSLAVTQGQAATFSALAAGSTPLSYQWFYNTNTALGSATNASFTIANVQLTNAGSYSVTVTNTVGSVTSSIVSLTVSAVPPSIITPPVNQSVTTGQSAAFSVVVGGTGPLSYQWYFEINTLLANATNAALTITNAQNTNAGAYTVVVTNTVGSVTSVVATLTVNVSGAKPSITTQPTNLTVTVGQNALFTTAVSGTSPLSYQWYFNVNTPLASGTNTSLAITSVQPDKLGGYTLIVTNSFGAVTSSVAQLTVTAAAGTPSLPVIAGGVYLITSYGAVGDGVTTNTTAIQNAINAASGAGGGTVEIPAGTYLSGPLTLKSKINLQIDKGAVLQMLTYTNWPGTTTFISGSSITDVEISGPGTIDGQGADWWAAFKASSISRPHFIDFSSCNRVSILDVTLQNPPTFHLMLKGNNGNLTIQGMTINTPGTSPNTDGMDLGSTNILVKDCYISDGDDNIEIGGSAKVADLVVTNCNFGTGHGVSMGSIVSGSVSNVTVVNCTFTNTDYGIRMKSDNDRGGVVQNCNYYNINMSSINKGAIVIYSYYVSVGTPTSVSSTTAAGETVATVISTTPIWRNIVISNVTATVDSSGTAGIIWGRTEMPVTNITLSHVNITASKNFDLYNVSKLTVADSLVTLPSGIVTYSLFDAQAVFINSAAVNSLITFDGATTTNYGNNLALYNLRSSLSATNALDDGPLTLGGATTLTVSNNLTLFATTILNYNLGASTVTNRLAVVGNLALGGTVNVATNSGFSTGTYTLMTYTGTLTGTLPTLGSAPSDFTCALATNIANQVNLIVTP